MSAPAPLLAIYIILLLLCLPLAAYAGRIAQAYGALIVSERVPNRETFFAALRVPLEVNAGSWCKVAMVMLVAAATVCYGHQRLGPMLVSYVFIWVLALLAMIDQRTGLLINTLTYPLIAFAASAMVLGWTIFWIDGLLAAVVISLFLLLTRSLLRMLGRGETLGLGDIKLFIAIGFWMGLHEGLLTLLLSSLLLLLGAALSMVRGLVLPTGWPFGPFVFFSVVVLNALRIAGFNP